MTEPERELKNVRRRRASTPEEELKCVEYLVQGINPNKIGRMLGRDRGFVIRAAEKHKGMLTKTMQEKLLAKKSELEDGLNSYTRYIKTEKRQEALSFAMDRVQAMLLRPELCPRDIKDLCICMGIIVDKYAVESGDDQDHAMNRLVQIFQQVQVDNATDTDRKARPVFSDPIETD